MQPFSSQVSGTKTTVTAVPSRVLGYHLMNTTAAIAYVQVFDKLAANVTVGTTTPDFVIPLAANGSAILPISPKPANPISFSTGCVIACCTSRSNSTGAAVDVLIWTENS